MLLCSDGLWYIDWIAGILSVSLGYGYERVHRAVRQRDVDGVNFSLPTQIESEVAQRLDQWCPGYQSVRYGKNGSDVLAAAVRMARMMTGRTRIIICGTYHGWADWCQPTKAGVPKPVAQLTRVMTASEKLSDVIAEEPPAAIVVAPGDGAHPRLSDELLREIRMCANRAQALMIADEICTGFRYPHGLMHTVGVHPDVLCVGKGMGNGYAVSALLSVYPLEDLCIRGGYSLTMGGETLSLTAAVATVDVHLEEPVIDKHYELGCLLWQGLTEIIKSYKLEEHAWLDGTPQWFGLKFSTGQVEGPYDPSKVDAGDWMKFLWRRTMANYGVLIGMTFNTMYAHSRLHVHQTLEAAKKAMGAIAVKLEAK